MSAQASQGLASFTLQVLCARLLGLEGLGRFAALYAMLILATALSSGFVGDSLTVLDRSERSVRAGIEFWLAVLSVLAGVLAWLGSWMVGFVDVRTALAFGGATMVFLVEDALRRTLMAVMKFWRIVIVDLTSLIASVSFILLMNVRNLMAFMLGLLVGQAAAMFVAILLLPRVERWLVWPWAAAVRETAAYGAWRAVQQMVRPALLAGVRVVCVVLVGVVATGELEAARIYMAPALLVVGGLSSFLFASYARDRGAPLTHSLQRADRSVFGLLGFVAVFAVLAVVAIPLLGPLLTAGEYALSVPAVAGWAAYAASVAAVIPYGSLAAVRGRQVIVLIVRASESALSLGLVALVVWYTNSIDWVPAVLVPASLIGGLCIRQLVLTPMLSQAEKAATGLGHVTQRK